MIHIKDVFVTPTYPDSIYVSWVVDNPLEHKHYLFNIYMSDNQLIVGDKVNILPIIDNNFFTIEKPLLSKQEYLYITVEAISEDGNHKSKPTTFTTSLKRSIYLLVREMKRKLDLLRNKKVGIECLLRKRIIYGEKCSQCVDPVTGYQIVPHCKACYDTQITRGYHDPIDVICEIVEGPRDIKPSEIGMIENIAAEGRMTSPFLFKGDILIEKRRNKRWFVGGVHRTALQTYMVDQKFELRQISPKDIEYLL